MPQFLVISTSTIVAYSDFSVNYYYYFLSLLFQPNHQYLNSASLYIMQHNVYYCQLIHASCLVFVLLASLNLFIATSMKTKLRQSNLYPHQLCACWLIAMVTFVKYSKVLVKTCIYSSAGVFLSTFQLLC